MLLPIIWSVTVIVDVVLFVRFERLSRLSQKVSQSLFQGINRRRRTGVRMILQSVIDRENTFAEWDIGSWKETKHRRKSLNDVELGDHATQLSRSVFWWLKKEVIPDDSPTVSILFSSLDLFIVQDSFSRFTYFYKHEKFLYFILNSYISVFLYFTNIVEAKQKKKNASEREKWWKK